MHYCNTIAMKSKSGYVPMRKGGSLIGNRLVISKPPVIKKLDNANNPVFGLTMSTPAPNTSSCTLAGCGLQFDKKRKPIRWTK